MESLPVRHSVADRLFARSVAGAVLLAAALSACQPADQAASDPAPAATDAATAAGSDPAEDMPDDQVLLPTLKCGPGGFIQPGDTRETLAETFGADNLREETVDWVDSTETALVLNPDEPATRVELLWLDKTSGGPRHVRVSGDQSQFLGPAGLFIGSTIEDVDWMGGKLDTPKGSGCDHDIIFLLPADVSAAASAAVTASNETPLRSDSPQIRAAKPVVDAFALNFR
jgi:hypothetical protein